MYVPLRGTVGGVMSPRLRSLRSLSLGLRIIVSLRDTTAGHEREALSVLREALNVLCVMCYVLCVMCYVGSILIQHSTLNTQHRI